MKIEAIQQFVDDYEFAQARLNIDQDLKVMVYVTGSFVNAEHSPYIHIDESANVISIESGFQGTSMVEINKINTITYKVVEKRGLTPRPLP